MIAVSGSIMWATYPRIEGFPSYLQTSRLLLRPLRADDERALAAMNADPAVMRYYPAPLTERESAQALRQNLEHRQHYGFGLYAVERIGVAGLIGCVGPKVSQFEAHFTPCVELAWRLMSPHWNQGLATEAATAVCHAAWRQTPLQELVALTAQINRPSQKVMRKLGMTRKLSDDFDHPAVPDNSPLKPHVLYRLQRGQGMQP